MLVTFCLNFPLTYSLARIAPYEMYTRMYGGDFMESLPESIRLEFTADAPVTAAQISEFNSLMAESGYGINVLLPLLGLNLVLILIMQAVFYVCAAVFLGLSRMNVSPLGFRQRLSLGVFSSTLPVLAAAVMGLALPTVHVIVFYFIVMFFIFQRSRICPNG